MLSSVHSADDIRIVEKEARSLSRSGFNVSVVARPQSPASQGDLTFALIDLPHVSRVKRPFLAMRAALAHLKTIQPDVVHFHDPELIPFGLWLKSRGCKVIYDAHEDVPADIYSKTWIPSFLHPPVAVGVEWIERITARWFDAIVAATPTIADRFRSYGARVSLVRNSVRLDEFITPAEDTRRKRQAVYIGQASFNRGLIEMVEACLAADMPLVLGGGIGGAEQDWLGKKAANVVCRGRLGRAEIASLLNESLVGLSLFHPEPNHLHAMPTKIFEYMAAGLPVITSDLPKSRDIIEQAGCGFSVSLNDPDALAKTLAMLAADSRHAIELGLAGRRAVSRYYNWDDDAAELRKLYRDVVLS
jgi:glycosyltransferase involved in cell wall biosynthesis